MEGAPNPYTMMTGTTADFEPDKIPLSDRRNVNELQVADMR